MNQPSVSVIVVSHGRPESLRWCISALAGLHYSNFEIIVVADPAGIACLEATRFAAKVKLLPFERANISAARNRGIAEAAGDIIAFIDDDAAAEPTWLNHLTAPFDQPQVSAVGGYVIGRNGISFQWTAREVDALGRAFDLTAAGEEAFLPAARTGCAIKTEGTNMAARANVLRALGGFDEVFAFYLDESDLNLRMAREGHQTALAPLAQVHHAYRASARRGDDRAVKDLFDVGASSVALMRKSGAVNTERLDEIRREQKARLEAQVARGLLAHSEADAVLDSLERGFEAGGERQINDYGALTEVRSRFLPFEAERRGGLVLSGWARDAETLREQAKDAAEGGANVSLFLFELSPRFHQVRFVEDGYWEQRGGLFGKSLRTQALIRPFTRKKRLKDELNRIRVVRGLS